MTAIRLSRRTKLAPSATVAPPNTPTSPVASAQGFQLQCNWTHGGGGTPTSHTIRIYDASNNSLLYTEVSGGTNSYTAEGPSQGDFVYFTVQAHNVGGSSAVSAASNNVQL